MRDRRNPETEKSTDMEYTFLQQYWWFIVSLLGGLLVFLMFVQGANTMIFSVGRTELGRTMVVNSTGRKWEFTFTTLVTFGGAFFASFPLFYSTSFGGAYWLWVLILVSFVFQAVSYEFQTRPGNILGRNTFRIFLVANGYLGPFLVGAAVATFFTGSDFIVDKGAIGDGISPVISRWGNPWHGLDALANVWNIILGLAVVFLSKILGSLYMLNNIDDGEISTRIRKGLLPLAVAFLVFFLAFLGHVLTGQGYAVASDGTVSVEPFKYWHNLVEMPAVLAIFLVGVLAVLYGIIKTIACGRYRRGIWWTGAGAVLAVLSIFLIAGYNGTAYYPSTSDLQSSLTISNSCSSFFTLKTMMYVSFIIPFVLAYIAYAWWSMDRKPVTREEMSVTEDKY